MPQYLIEREIPGVNKFTWQQLKEISEKSCFVLDGLGPSIEWVHSYVAGDKLYCIYNAPNEDIVREHARIGGFPANVVNEVTVIIGPETAQR